MRSILHTLLLATLFTLCVLAVPVPMSDDEIQARWKRGESEVGCLPNGAGCYVLAWWRSLSPRNVATIHAAQSHRDAPPAWPMLDRGSNSDSVFSFATDERTTKSHVFSRESPMTPKLLTKMKNFVKTFYRNRGEKAPGLAAGARSERAEEAPVLRPRRSPHRYHFSA
ncbi:hypothetical protein LTR09_000272 [Extremus antarcticus]|uniref:Uncharacterized protein n=1 Tax=Extremus antarcticus TaxID=702011 RepID=A0AAJ0LX65_9PEZI|nr:hypothetical protein LTR09_000272 [Extremus antarcticus]